MMEYIVLQALIGVIMCFCAILRKSFGVSTKSVTKLFFIMTMIAVILFILIDSNFEPQAVEAVSSLVGMISAFWGFCLMISALLNGGFGRWFKFLICSAVTVISFSNGWGTVWDWTLKIVPWLLAGIVAIVVIYFIYEKIDDLIFYKKREKEVKEWLAKPTKSFTEQEIVNTLKPLSDKISSRDSNENSKFDSNIPFGRANCFLNYFDKSIDIEEPIYYSPIRSKDDVELREYGFLLTNGGIYMSSQIYDSENDKYITKRKHIDFKGMMDAWYNTQEHYLYIKYVDIGNSITIKKDNTSVSLSYMEKICKEVINSGISRALYKEQVFKDGADLAERKFEGTQNVGDISRGANIGAFAVASANNIERFEQIGNVMNARQGGGYAAELANDTTDKLASFVTGDKVEYLGQIKDESGHIIKGGADRRVNGVNIQTKYYQSASGTVNSAFENGHPKYINPDGSMMVIEVPRDQYKEACIEMEKKIEKGEVPGAKKGDSAKYVKKGMITYKQSQNITKSGCIESITFDAANGIVCSVPAATITAMITFASAVWNGLDTEEAVCESFATFSNVIGKAALQAVIIGQLGRKDIARVFVSQTKSGFQTTANPIYGISDKIATKVSSSAIAKSSIGKSLKLDAVNGKKLIGGTVMFAFTFGPDICRALVGRISPQQLFKNSCIGAAGLVGASIGQAVIPIPVLGGIIGGAVGGFIAKKTLDNFIEDDAKEMYQILKEEFLDVVMIAGLNKEEFEYVMDKTFGNKKLPHMLRDMYQYGDAREYARDNIVSQAVVGAYSKRKKITQKMYRKAIFNAAKKAYSELYSQPIYAEFEDLDNDDSTPSIFDTEALPIITSASVESVLNQKMPDKEKYEKIIKDTVDMRSCPFCGKEVKKTDLVCTNCGNFVIDKRESD